MRMMLQLIVRNTTRYNLKNFKQFLGKKDERDELFGSPWLNYDFPEFQIYPFDPFGKKKR